MITPKERKRAYVRFYPKAAVDPAFPSEYHFHLINTKEAFIEAVTPFLGLPDSKKMISFDCETTGLDPTCNHMVGFSFCYNSHHGYYVPLRHIVDADLNAPFLCLKAIYHVLTEAVFVSFFNASFDLRFIRREGFDISKINLYDASVPVWIMDSNIRMPDLKDSARWFLGWQMQKFEDVTKDAPGTFQEVSPKDGLFYAATDALATYNLTFEAGARAKKHTFTVKLDNGVIPAVMAMEDEPTHLNLDRIKEIKKEVTDKISSLEKEVFNLTGHIFNISSYDQLGAALESLGLETYRKTQKTQKMKTDIDSLEQIEHLHPVVEKIVEFKRLRKLLTSYINPLIKGFREDLKGVRFNYNLQAASTGRLSSSGDEKNTYFVKVNVQSTPKPHPLFYSVVEDSHHPDALLGYVFSPIGDFNELKVFREQYPQIAVTEGKDPKLNLRTAFLPKGPDHLIVSLDYSGQELRIPANFSGEPTWVNAFQNGEDPHKATAIKMWGEDLYDNDRRKMAKTLNFGALYGGSKRTFARTLRCSEGEAQDLLDQWWSTLRVLKSWTDSVKAQGKKHGYVVSAFGRPRRLRHWFASPKWGERKFAERIAVNQKVQGTAADMIRLALIRVREKVVKKKTYEKVYALISSVHDELNSSIHKDWLFEIIPVLKKCMDIKVPGWKVPMDVGLEIGKTWGSLFQFELKGDRLIPVLEK
jgi:DNA polymerase-1